MAPSYLEKEFMLQIIHAHLPLPERECQLIAERRWKCDFFWPSHQVVFEIEGGVYIQGRHTRGVGFTRDCEKYNEFTLQGYRVFRVTSEHVKNGKALNWLRLVLNE